MAYIAVIDDSRMKRDFLTEILKDSFSVAAFASGDEALSRLADIAPMCILLDIEMPGKDGFQVLECLKSTPSLADIPVIFVTSHDDRECERRGLQCGAVDFIGSRTSPEIIRARVMHHVELYEYRCQLERKVREKTRTALELQDAIMLSLSDLVELRDENTSGHAQRIGDYVACLVRQMQADGCYPAELTKSYVADIIRAAPLHDIGKVGIRDSILNKPDRLTPEEFEEMKRHTVYGATAIMRAMSAVHEKTFLTTLRDISVSHHEHWDGSGYPLGLRGTQIPLCGRILAIPDVYDALISRRSYKGPLSHTEALAIIRDGLGTHFDPCIGAAFLHCADDFRKISQRYR